MKDMIQLLCQHVAPSGSEQSLQRVLLEMLSDVADETWVDVLGNGIASKDGTGPHVMLTAHADVPGVMVIDIDDNGFLRILPLGHVDAASLVGRHVRFVNGTSGLIGAESKVKLADISFDHLYVDLGCTSRVDAGDHVRIGTSGIIADPVVALPHQRLAGSGLDNRVGCAIVVQAFRQLAAAGCRVSAVFTAQHEAGARGVKTAAFRLLPDLAMVIDAVPTGDMPEADRMSVQLGGGPVIKVMDGTFVTPVATKQLLEESAAALEMSVQYEVRPRSLTDAGGLQRTQTGVRVAGLSYPARYVGRPSTIIDLRDVEQTLALLVAAVLRQRA